MSDSLIRVRLLLSMTDISANFHLGLKVVQFHIGWCVLKSPARLHFGGWGRLLSTLFVVYFFREFVYQREACICSLYVLRRMIAGIVPVSICSACTSWSSILSGLGCHLMKEFSFVTNVIVRGGLIDVGMILSNEGCDMDAQFPREEEYVYGSCMIMMSVMLIEESRSDSMMFWFFLQLCCVICILCGFGCIDIRPM